MTKKIISFCVLILCLNLALAQNNDQKMVTIKGKILEKDTNAPLEYATVVFKNTTNPADLSGGITDASGNYSIEIKSGTYNVSFEYIGFKTEVLPNKSITDNQTFKTQYLSIDAEALDEIEIIAEKTTVEIRLDKKIYNVGKDLTVRGGTVSDVLDNVPSVSVDVEGNVALRGNDNVRILINGKPSGLVGLNSTDALRQLPAESIEKVEVITSPSARYESEGTAGILNIILKRSKLEGLNGAITTNVGYNPSAGINGNINYRTGDINIFNTTGYSYREAPGNSFTSTQYKSTGNFLDETNTFDRIRKGLTTNFGVEWYVNDSASLTTSVLYRDSDDENSTTNLLEQFDTNRNLLSTTVRLDPEFEEDKTIQYALNFQKNYSDSGHVLTFDFQYEDSSENENSLVQVDNVISERVATLEDQQQILLQTDYVLPIGENSQFEAGYRGNFNTTSTDFQVELLDSDTNQFELSTDLTNLLNFKEYLNAVYTQYGTKINKFSFLLGLRLENTQLTIDQPTTGDYNKRNFTGLFPTVNLNYEFSDRENLTLGYARRLRRPRGFFLNPFPSRSSVTNYFQGNPSLNPSYSGQFDLGYLKRFGKFTFNSSLYYAHATDVFNFVSFDTGDTAIVNGESLPIIQRTPINLATEDRYGFEFTLTYNPSRNWRVNGNFNFFQNDTKGTTPNGLSLDNTNNSWFARINNKYTLPGEIDWQTNLNYRGPSEDAQTKSEGIFTTTMAFSKDLFGDSASIAFNVNDLFNSRKRQQNTTTPTFDAYSEYQWRERSFNLAFTYRFNQKKKRVERGSYGGDDDFEG
ncbi:outer membrane beta-barrel family protein [Olleya sp. Hel_I_94]|uniref:outer membrane beta-barrel family protein n=1 Tax=Olleya sp. Hel_I_94 TaxID=1250001 RepID=UPI0011A87D49|nr:outer membrane beta-barrel family protein [Olleya sp. Hel_I_94]TVZ46650.1 outer membrane receptor protein involved in Fe transport [Olleya sp. Hel_I_94]